MRAVTLAAFRQPVEIREHPVPEPAADQVLINMRAAGVCGTDVKLWNGHIPDTPLPLVLGHENAGEVAGWGQGVEGLSKGQRVVTLHHVFCGSCDRCQAGDENLCRNLRGRIGFDLDGGWADYLLAPAENVFPIPDGVALETACVIPDAVATTWRACVRVAAIESDEQVAVLGIGGLGLSACQIAASRGAIVTAIDISDEKLEPSRRAGIDGVLADEAAELASSLPAGGFDCLIDCAGTPGALELAPALLATRGRLIQVGYSPGETLRLPTADVALRELEVRGCRAASRRDLAEALEAVAAGTVTPLIASEIALENAQQALDALMSGDVVGRQILVID